MEYPKELTDAALERARESRAMRAETVESLLQQHAVVEPAEERLTKVVARRSGLTPPQVEKFFTLQQINNLLPISFAEGARQAANAVGRLVTPAGRGAGTCFLISEQLLITAGHALPNETAAQNRVVEFNFELDGEGESRQVSRYRLAPERFFVTDPVLRLDFTVVALGELESGPVPELAYCPLTDLDDKHALGFCANVIQHPRDLDKQLAVRENRLVFRTDELLVYMTETRGGSSGAPVFNDDWEVVAVHHWGGTTGRMTLPSGISFPDNVNEGVRASAIVNALLERHAKLPPAWRTLLDEAIPTAGPLEVDIPAVRTNGSRAGRPRPQFANR